MPIILRIVVLTIAVISALFCKYYLVMSYTAYPQMKSSIGKED